MAFFSELKRRNVIKATISYLVISFAIIEASDILFPVLGIDSSYIRVLFIILSIGLPIWIVFAYVYEWTPTGFKATDKVDETKSIYKTTEKRLNRVIIGALVLAVAFLLVDKFYLGKEAPFPENGSIAIFPFAVQGTENIQYLREGMVDLIATKLDAIPGIQASDPNILLSTLSKNSQNSALLRDPKEAAILASEIGANRLVLGSLTEVGNVLQIKISKYDLGGNPIGGTIVEEGELNTLYQKTDEIIQRLVSEELREQGLELASDGVISTSSFDAMIPYLKGIQLYRAGSFKSAKSQFEEAIAIDSLFTMAYYQLSKTMGWINNRDWDFKYATYPKLERLSTTLSGKTKEIVQAYLKFSYGDITVVEDYERLYEMYGESLEILGGLAESYYHLERYTTAEQTRKYFERLVEIDPDNKEFNLHLAELAYFESDGEEFQNALKKFTGDSANSLDHRFNLLLFKDTVTDRVLERMANEFYISRFRTPGMNSGPLIGKGVTLIERMLKLNPKLWARDSSGFLTSKKIIGGKHSEVIRSPLNARFALMQLSMDYFPPDVEMAKEDIKRIIEAWKQRAPNPQDSLNLTWAYQKFYLGKFSLYVDDMATYQQSLEYLARIASIDNTGDYEKDSYLAEFRYFYYALQGVRAFLEKDAEKGKELFHKADLEGVKGSRRMYDFVKSSHKMVYEAELLLEGGKYEEALNLYSVLFKYDAYYDYYGGYMNGRYVYRLAQCHDALGNHEEAIAYYNQFARAYEHSDPTYQGWVSNANERLKVLVSSPERVKEPEEI